MRRFIKHKRSLIDNAPKSAIIERYSTFSSEVLHPPPAMLMRQVYAPIAREGRRIDKDSHKYVTEYAEGLSLADLDALERSLPRSLLSTVVRKPKLSVHRSAVDARKASQLLDHLAKMEDKIEKRYAKEVAHVDDDLAEYRKAPVVLRPPTPTLDVACVGLGLSFFYF